MVTALLRLRAFALHVALLLGAAPLLEGLRRWFAARLLGEAGPPPWQPWRDLARLARKQAVRGEGAGAVALAGPTVDFAASLAAAALVPGFAYGMATAPAADLILFAGLLMLARVARALTAMEVGTAPGGIAAAAVMSRASLAEPALLLAIFALALAAGGSNIDAVAMQPGPAATAPRALALVALALVAFAQTRRAEALSRELSGWPLALANGAAALRLTAVLSLIAALFLPWGITAADGLPLLWPAGVVLWGVKLALLTAGLAAAETLLVPPPLPRLLGVAAVLAWLAVALFCAGQRAT